MVTAKGIVHNALLLCVSKREGKLEKYAVEEPPCKKASRVKLARERERERQNKLLH